MSRLPTKPPAAEITPEALYQRRRDFLKNTALFAGTAAALGTGLLRLVGGSRSTSPVPSAEPLPVAITPPAPPSPSASAELGAPLTDEKTPFADITTYNNYYELGLSKSAPAQYGHLLQPRPWTIRV